MRWTDLVRQVLGALRDDPGSDRQRDRILDAAVQEAASVGLQRITIEDVVRRVKLGRMTVYRRFARRDDLVEALVLREMQRFLAAVTRGAERAISPEDGVAEAFVAAVTFAREHPLLRRLAHAEPGAVTETMAAGDASLLRMGAAYIADKIHGDREGAPSREVRWAADVLARLFLTWIAIPPTDPRVDDDEALRTFAREVLNPIVARSVGR